MRRVAVTVSREKLKAVRAVLYQRNCKNLSRYCRLWYVIFTASSLCLGITACGPKVPTVTAWRPWTRTVSEPSFLQLGQEISTTVSGQTTPLIGSESPLQNYVDSLLHVLLQRRGYLAGTDTSSMQLNLSYKTERYEEFVLTSRQVVWLSSGMATASYSGSVASAGSDASNLLGAGAAIAASVAKLFSYTQISSEQTIEPRHPFVHVVAAELVQSGDSVLWKGEAAWQSESVDIRTELLGALQLLLLHLPADRTTIPRVLRLKSSHYETFFSEHCLKRAFSCPAVPYLIRFVDPGDFQYYVDVRSFVSPGDAFAFPAFLDIIQTAEYALPVGREDYSDPVDLDLWKKVTLFGKYQVGDNKQPVNAVVELHGTSTHYEVARCWIASETEYSSLQVKMAAWMLKLRGYYSMFEE